MMPINITIDGTVYISVIGILLSGILGVLISHWMTRRAGQLSAKRNLLSRFAGNRFVLTDPLSRMDIGGEPFVVLNEICVVYAKDKGVINALKKFHEEIDRTETLLDNMVTLIRQMAKAAKVPIDRAGELNNEFFLKPFTPHRASAPR